MNDLYKTFKCKNKEELYIKLKEKNPDVRELLDYIDYAKITRTYNKSIKFSNAKEAVHYINNLSFNYENQVNILFVNIKMQPIHFVSIKEKDPHTMRKVLYDGLNSGAYGSFFIYSKNIEKIFIDDVKDIFTSSGICEIDSFIYNKEKNEYFAKRDYNNFEYFPGRQEALTEKSKPIENKEDRDYYKYRNSDDFFRYYTEKEIEGLNLNKDEEKINSLLRVGFQNPKQEFLYSIFYDEKKDITGIENISVGGIDASILDFRVLTKKLLEYNPKGLVVFHNHPSGDYTPSRADYEASDKIKKIANKLGYEYLNNLVIAKKGVFSLKKRKEEFSFSKDEELEF